MDKLISLEPSNLVAIRIEPGQRCYGELTLRNVMHTMPVAFRFQPMNKNRYTVRPQSGIISPLSTITLEITYTLPPNSNLPDSFPHSDDSFLLHSVVVPGAAVKDPSSTYNSVPNDWFATRKKQLFTNSDIKTIFVGSLVLAQLMADGSMDDIREVLKRSDSEWRAVDSVDEHGQTLLHLAIAQSRADLVQLLLEFNPNVEFQSQTGRSPLEAAAASGDALIVELLLGHRASTEKTESAIWGPLHLAARGGYMDVIRLLLLKGAHVDELTGDHKCTALHLAVEESRRDCVRLLLASGAKVDASTGNGDTALHIAASLGDEYMIKLLLQKRANKDIRNRLGKTAYDAAVEYGFSHLFDSLRLGDSLCVAARKGEMRMMQQLFEKGALINGRDQHGWTALHRASFKGRVEAVRILVEKGADFDARDEDGYTALHCAAESGQANVIELLMKKGADVEARTNKGVTALQIAESLQYLGITRVLVHGGATKDGMGQFAGPLPLPFGTKMIAGEMDNVGINKKPSRARTRAIRSSFDRSMPLAVI